MTSGAPDYRIDVPRVEAFDPGAGDFTMAFWVKRDQTDTTSGDGIFDALGITGNGTGYQCFFSGDPDMDHIKFRLDDVTGDFKNIKSQNPMADATAWHHVALTVDRSNREAVMYVDGIADPPVDIKILRGALSPDQNLHIGGFNSGQKGLDGKLDELRFYNYVLSQAEIDGLIAGTSCPADLDGNGVIDLGDIQAFIVAFLATDDIADLGPPFGVWDLADVQLFVSSFIAGCN